MAATAFELHDEAEQELDDAAAVIEGARSGWGFQFITAFHVAVASIMDHPELGQVFRELRAKYAAPARRRSR